MIGSDNFATVFGAAPAGDAEAFASIVKAAVRAGYSPVLLQPNGKEPGCILAPATAAKADKARMDQLAAAGQQSITNVRHECGFKHVLEMPHELNAEDKPLDPARKVTGIVTRFASRYGTPLNLGLHLGRSRLIAVDVDTPAEREAFRVWWQESVGHGSVTMGMTQESPGSFDVKTQTWKHWGGGHWVFTVPDDWQTPPGRDVKGPGGFAVMYGESYILVPPSVRSEGPYRLVGGTNPAPAVLLELIAAGAAREIADRAAFVLDHADPIEQWSAYWSWAQILEPDGWSDSGARSDCGCPEWTAPGDHASPKSATAHEPGCTLMDTSTGWAPLHIWTDHPPEPLVSSGGTVTKLDYVSRMHYGGDVKAAMNANALLMEKEVLPALRAFDAGSGADPFVPAGAQSPAVAPNGGQVALPSSPYSVPQRTLRVQLASQITPRATRWLWADQAARWIALGGLTLLSGREGVGKSTWAYRIAALLTQGALPGAFYGVARSVVVAATEDAWEQTIVPRLLAAGADLNMILRVEVETATGGEGLTLPTDVRALAQICSDYSVALILLDPLMGTISGSLDSHKDAEVRRALEPITRLADVAKLSVIGLIHQNKGGKGDLLQKLMASVAFSAVARGVLVCARDEEAVDAETGEPTSDHYVFGQAKSNLGPLASHSIRYRIESAHVGHDQDLNEPIWSSRIVEMGDADEQIGDIVNRQGHPNREAPALKSAEDWIKSYLDLKGPIPSSDVKQAGKDAGHKPDALIRAASRLGVIQPDPEDKRRTFWCITGVGAS
jgi:AAA domain/Bifunctional DNA primase/polymerase, N-terminal